MLNILADFSNIFLSFYKFANNFKKAYRFINLRVLFKFFSEK